MKNKKVILSISYGNYTLGLGGTDKVILAHQKMFNSVGYKYIFIFPIHNIGKKVKLKTQNEWGIIEDGKFNSIKSTGFLILWLRKHYKKLKEIHVHHLKGISLVELNNILGASAATIRLFLHDYYTICENYNLLYNDSIFCGIGRPSEKKCVGCNYYVMTAKRKIDSNFLKKWRKRLVAVAPSETAKDIWCKSYPEFQNIVDVVPHQTLIGRYEDNIRQIGSNDKIKLAFVGGGELIKGYEQWKKLINQISKANVYEVYHFGYTSEPIEGEVVVDVDFKKDLNAMVNALRNYKIDCALLWSIWPETYAYTYYECLASNVFVISNIQSGNICKQIEKNQNGIVFESDLKLYQFFENVDLVRSNINNAKKHWIYGPEKLEENRYIINLTEQSVDSKIEKKGIIKERVKMNSKDFILSILYIGSLFKNKIGRNKKR